jgi:hypothetical protein
MHNIAGKTNLAERVGLKKIRSSTRFVAGARTSSVISFKRSIRICSRRFAMRYVWNSPLPAPAVEPKQTVHQHRPNMKQNWDHEKKTKKKKL